MVFAQICEAQKEIEDLSLSDTKRGNLFTLPRPHEHHKQIRVRKSKSWKDNWYKCYTKARNFDCNDDDKWVATRAVTFLVSVMHTRGEREREVATRDPWRDREGNRRRDHSCMLWSHLWSPIPTFFLLPRWKEEAADLVSFSWGSGMGLRRLMGIESDKWNVLDKPLHT